MGIIIKKDRDLPGPFIPVYRSLSFLKLRGAKFIVYCQPQGASYQCINNSRDGKKEVLMASFFVFRMDFYLELSF